MARWTGELIGGVASALLGLVLAWAARRGRPATAPDGRGLLFRYGTAYRALARLVAFGAPPVVIACALARPPRDVGTVLGACALFAALGLPFWWETTRFALIVRDEGLDCRSPWRGRQFFPWAEVEEVAFSRINQWFIIRARYGRRFRFHVLVGGVADLLDELEARLEPGLLGRARAGYEQVGLDHPMSRD